MATDTNEIRLTAETTIDDILDAADEAPVQIDRNGVVYEILRKRLEDPNEWDEELAERRRRDLWETAGAWRDIDTKQMIADIYRWREEGSRNWDRS
jgi:hypothetical protein